MLYGLYSINKLKFKMLYVSIDATVILCLSYKKMSKNEYDKTLANQVSPQKINVYDFHAIEVDL